MDAIGAALQTFLVDFLYALFLYAYNIILGFTGDFSLGGLFG